MASTIAIVVGGLTVIYILLRLLLSVTQDAREPPAILNGLPFLRPLIGMIKEKENFHLRLRDEHQLPIYTLRLPFQRMYIVNDTRLVPLLQKQWRHVSFAAIAADAGKAVGMSKEALDIMHEGLATDEGFSVSWPRYIMPALAPGRDLDAINRSAIEVIAADTERKREKGPHTVALAQWSRQILAASTTEAVWGPQNPYRDAGVTEAWKTYEAGFLILSMFPSAEFLFPKVVRARELIAAAMTEYVRQGGHKRASGLVRKRYEHHIEQFGLTLDDFARGELGNTFALLGNTLPCALWMLWHTFSDPQVLKNIRDEVSVLVRDDQPDVRSIDLSSIRESCPILLSTFQEVLRYRSVSLGPRVLLEDVMLDGQTLLKKGSMLMIPSPVHHSNVASWGADVKSFDYLRFVQKSGTGKKLNRVAFRAFGGGHQLCPGRHFASTEIMALAALMVLQFDMVPVAGAWNEPVCKNSPLQAGFPIPDEDIQVELHPRDPRKSWNVTFSGSDAVMGIVSEDTAGVE